MYPWYRYVKKFIDVTEMLIDSGAMMPKIGCCWSFFHKRIIFNFEINFAFNFSGFL